MIFKTRAHEDTKSNAYDEWRLVRRKKQESGNGGLGRKSSGGTHSVYGHQTRLVNCWKVQEQLAGQGNHQRELEGSSGGSWMTVPCYSI